MRFFNLLKTLPPFCFLALAWLAHNTFRRSPGPNSVPPFIRRKACFTLQGAGLIRVDVDGNPQGLFCLRVDWPIIVPPFIRRRACFTLHGAGLIRVDVDGNPQGLFCLRVDWPIIVPPFIRRRACFTLQGSGLIRCVVFIRG